MSDEPVEERTYGELREAERIIWDLLAHDERLGRMEATTVAGALGYIALRAMRQRYGLEGARSLFRGIMNTIAEAEMNEAPPS